MTALNRVTGRPQHASAVVAGLVIDPSNAVPYRFPVRQDDLVPIADGARELMVRLDPVPMDGQHADLEEVFQRASPGYVPLAESKRMQLHVDVPEERLRPLPEDEQIVTSLPHLAAVAKDPDSRLVERFLKVPAGRSRRPARRAERVLAASSEDWLRRRPRTVVPSRLLDRRLDHDLGIYDNHVAAALALVHLPRWIGQRLSSVRKEQERRRETWESFSTGSSHRLARMTRLLGSPPKEVDDEASGVADQTRQLLEGLAGKVRRIAGSPLARAVGPVQVGGSLNLTNRMINDQHYRHLPPLWDVAVRGEDAVDLEALRSAAQQPHHAMVVHSFALLVHALEELEYSLTETVEGWHRGEQIHLDGPWGRVAILWTELNVAQLTTSDGGRLRLVPLAVDLPDLIDETPVPDLMATLGPIEDDTFVLHRGAARDGDELQLQARRAGLDLWDRFVVVEPSSAGSLERLGRLVTRAVVGSALKRVPVVVELEGDPVPPRLRSELPWPANARTGDAVELVGPVSAKELDQLRRAVRSELARASQGRGWQAEHRRHLEQVVPALEQADRLVSALLTCPVCGRQTRREAWQVDGEGFRVSCGECSSWWGRASCGACGSPFEVLHHPILRESRDESEDGWIGRLLGRDVLAEPCWKQHLGPPPMICPTCRSCPADDGTACPRGCGERTGDER
jgi:hypothetical protein